jgi:hypothetical protein
MNLPQLALAAISSNPACDQAATAFLAVQCTLDNQGRGSITFEITGTAGTQAFTFASGTTAGSIAMAIAAFEKQTGIAAQLHPGEQSCQDEGVVLQSIMAGADAFVSVTQLDGAQPIVYAAPGVGAGAYAYTDAGVDGRPGDVNCDQAVDAADLALVIEGWGACPQPPDACAADLDGSGVVNVDDVLMVFQHWGAVQ